MNAAILAAGRSKRMGRNKLVLPLGDRAIVRWVADEVVAIASSKVLVVVRPEGRQAIAESLDRHSVTIIENPRADEGMGTSIARAAEFLSGTAEPFLLLQGDQPFVSSSALRELADRFAASEPAFAASRYDGLVTTPVLFSAPLAAELCELEGDRGARDILRSHWGRGMVVDLPAWMGLDVDDEEAYRRACAIVAERSRSAS